MQPTQLFSWVVEACQQPIRSLGRIRLFTNLWNNFKELPVQATPASRDMTLLTWGVIQTHHCPQSARDNINLQLNCICGCPVSMHRHSVTENWLKVSNPYLADPVKNAMTTWQPQPPTSVTPACHPWFALTQMHWDIWSDTRCVCPWQKVCHHRKRRTHAERLACSIQVVQPMSLRIR